MCSGQVTRSPACTRGHSRPYKDIGRWKYYKILLRVSEGISSSFTPFFILAFVESHLCHIAALAPVEHNWADQGKTLYDSMNMVVLEWPQVYVTTNEIMFRILIVI